MSDPELLESTLPYPPIYEEKKFVVLSDWYVYCVLVETSQP